MDLLLQCALDWGVGQLEAFDVPRTLIAVDASSDPDRTAYAGVMAYLRWGELRTVRIGQVTKTDNLRDNGEIWAVRCALQCARWDKFSPSYKIVFTDFQSASALQMRKHEKVCWVPRTTEIVRQMHRAANAARKACVFPPLITP